MKYNPIFSVLALAIVILTACHREPTPENVSLPTDSLITVAIPDFSSIVSTSRTPSGKLDQISYASYFPSLDYTNATNLLYDDQQRLIGHTALDSPSKGVDNAYIYEYKNNLPYRVFYKGAAYGSKTYSFYFMDQLVHDASGRQTGQLFYTVDLKGNARLSQRYKLVYDSANHLIEVKDPNGLAVGQRFTYERDNMRLMEHVAGDGTVLATKTEFRYDTKPNAMKGVYWSLNLDYIHLNLSANNLVGYTIRTAGAQDVSTEYTNDYDTKDRLIRRTNSSPSGRIVESYIFKD